MSYAIDMGFVSVSTRLPLRNKHRTNRCRCTPIATASSPSGAVVTPDEWDLNLKSPAKINLFLRILGKRKDGYHELASLFQAISFHDSLSVSMTPYAAEDVLECNTPGVPTDSRNLVLQAFNKFREKTGITTRFRARLDKRIPHSAGLGGGSGNAATALWAANKLTKAGCSDEELAQLGAEFGSDISFFFTNGTAYCTGRGDKMVQLDRLSPTTLYIVKPKESLSTRDVFNALDVKACKNGPDPRDLIDKIKQGIMWADFVNDLETPSFQLLPRLKTVKEALYESGFNVVMMTGSGTAFFCLGHPSNPDDFSEVFPTKYNVKIEPCLFACRELRQMWNFHE